MIVALVKQMWPLRLIRFMRIRAKYNATGTDKTPVSVQGAEAVEGGGDSSGRSRILAVAVSLAALFYLADKPGGRWSPCRWQSGSSPRSCF